MIDAKIHTSKATQFKHVSSLFDLRVGMVAFTMATPRERQPQTYLTSSIYCVAAGCIEC